MAGSIIGALRVVLALDSSRFNDGARDAERRADRLSGHMRGIGAGLKSLAVGFAGALATGALIDAAKKGLEYASSLGEVSQQLGVSTKDLQEYRYAATQAGLSQDEMDASLAKLTRTLGEADAGAKGPSAAFAQLGISVRDASGHVKSAGDILPEIAEAMKLIPDPAQRAALLVDLLGKSGQKLEPLLAGGADGINSLRDAAQKLGIVLSSEQIQKADDAADKIAAVKQVLEARIAGVVTDNVDSILALIDALGKLVQWSGKAAAAWRSFSLDVAAKQHQNFADGFFTSAKDRYAALQKVSDIRQEQLDLIKSISPKENTPKVVVKPKPAARAPVADFTRGNAGALSRAAKRPFSLTRYLVAPNEADFGFDFKIIEERLAKISTVVVPETIDGIRDQFARLDGVMVSVAQAATAKTSQAFLDLAGRTQSLLDSLFPEQAEIAALQAKYEALDAALAAKLISPLVYSAARDRLRGELEKLRAEADAQLLGIEGGLEFVDVTKYKIEDLGETFRVGLGDQAAEQTGRVAESFAEMAQSITDALGSLVDTIKGGDFFDIIGAVFGALDKIGKATGGFGIGPFEFGGSGSGSDSSTPAFATGGSFTVGGVSGIDKNLVQFRATKGEMVNITKGGQSQPRGGTTNVFDMRGAVMMAELMADINAKVAAGEARATVGGASLARSQFARSQRGRMA